MAYSELIKSFSRVREYIRELYVFGFRYRGEVGSRSPRSYDNERRRIESWLGEYVRYEYDAEGKRTFISVDTRSVSHNLLYQVFKAKSFTDGDIWLHFSLLDLLPDGTGEPAAQLKEEKDDCLPVHAEGFDLREIMDRLENAYIGEGERKSPDESTVRKKLNEYAEIGLITKHKSGKKLLYTKNQDKIDLSSWRDALLFYSEVSPIGVVGSFLLDKLDTMNIHSGDVFRFKHHSFLFALESEVLYELLDAIYRRRSTVLTMQKQGQKLNVIPARILISTRYGRAYLLAWNPDREEPAVFRLDRIHKVKQSKQIDDLNQYLNQINHCFSHIWGVSAGRNESFQEADTKGKPDHVELLIYADETEGFVVDRLRKEKRCGTVSQEENHTWRFSADVLDALEMLPWIRTFIGRIISFTCTNPFVEERFRQDLSAMCEMYSISCDQREENKEDGTRAFS